MSARCYTTCRDLALVLDSCGVPVEFSRRENGSARWFYPAWAGRAHQLIRAAVPPRARRAVLTALASHETRRAELFALADAGLSDRVRLYLLSLSG